MAQHRQQRAAPQPTWWRKFFNTPKGLVFFSLLLVMVIGALHPSDAGGVKIVGVAMVTGILCDMVMGLVHRNKRWWFGDGGAITGLIIGLVLSSLTPILVTVLTTIVAMASKHLLKRGRMPVFNPAAFGLLVAIYAFHTGQSWWGDFADLPTWCIVLLLFIGFFVVKRVNKFPLVLTFLGSYFALLAVAGYLHFGSAAFTPGDALRMPIVNSAVFMALFMLTDPPTSPAKYKDQIMFALITAVLSVAIYLIFGGLTYLLIGLLVANSWYKWKAARRSSAKVPVQPLSRMAQP